jgi:hypothetical protein
MRLISQAAMKSVVLLTGWGLCACQLQNSISTNKPPLDEQSDSVTAAPQNQSTPSPSSTIKPSALPLPSPSSDNEEKPIPTPFLSPSPSGVPSVLTPSPSPTAPSSECTEPDIDTVSCESIHGYVYDEKNQPLSDVLIDIYYLNKHFTAKTDKTGLYHSPRFIPQGTTLVKASKPGYVMRYLSFYESNKRNDVNFGSSNAEPSTYSDFYLDNGPEVIDKKIIINQGNPGLPTFSLTFNEPVDKKSIEDKTGVYAASSFFTELIFPTTYGGAYTQESSLIPGWISSAPFDKSLVIKPENLSFSWNADQTQVTISFKPGFQLPLTNQNTFATSRDVFGTGFFDPVSQNRTIYDLNGNGRMSKHFNFQPDCTESCLQMLNISTVPTKDIGHWTYQFSLVDNLKPRLLSLQALDASLRLNFSEIMAIQTYKYLIAGGMIDMLPPGLPGSETRSPAEYPGNLGNVTGRKTAANYKLKITRAGSEVLNSTWKALGGVARYDSEDPNRQSVRLHPPRSTQAVNGFYPAYSWISTTALPSGFGQGSSPEQNWILRWQGVRRDGTLGTQRTATLAGNALRTAPEWATQLQLALQANSSEEGNWQVQASADGSQLKLRLESTDGEYLGWKLVSMESPSAAFPSTLATASQNWAANTDWHWWQAGDSLTLEVINPIFDPAGNSIDPAGKIASLTLP